MDDMLAALSALDAALASLSEVIANMVDSLERATPGGLDGLLQEIEEIKTESKQEEQ